MNLWGRFLPHRRIGTRIVVAVTCATAVVLLGSGAFVFWRVDYALNRQLDQDLRALRDVSSRSVTQGTMPPSGVPGRTVQVYAEDGRLLERSDASVPRLLPARDVRAATRDTLTIDTGTLIPPSDVTYRVTAFGLRTTTGRVVVAAAISRTKRDEALRELLLQLGLTDLLAIVASSFVGYAVARAALGPVEQYRRSVEAAGTDTRHRLPVEEDRDDELTRLGHTFNDLLDAVAEGHARERGYLADASHELRSPLALLAAEIEWAQHRRRTPEQLAEVLASVGVQVATLVHLANALLDLEEVQNVDGVDRRTPVRVDALVETAVGRHRGSADALGRTMDVHAPANLVHVDAHRVDLALGNLVGNAVKHGSGTVRVDAAVAGGRLRVVVADDGPGVPAGLGERAFDRFTRGDPSRSTPGNGLGLALVRAAAESQGGTAGLVPGGVYLEVPV